MKIDKKNIIIIVLLVVLAFTLFGQLFGDGSGIDRVRDYLNAIDEQQQSAINRLEGIESGLSESIEVAGAIATGINEASNSINSAKDRLTASETRLNESAELIARGKQILGTIRERSQKATK